MHFTIIFSFILISRVVNLLAFQEPSIQPDSSGYSSSKILDFSLVSFTGNSLRSWPAPLLFALMPSATAKIIGQMLISIVVWTHLSYVLLKISNSNQIKNLFVVILTVSSTNPILLQWETTLLGQSLLISNVIFLITLSVQLKFHFSKLLAFFSVLGCVLLFLQKSNNIFVTFFFFAYFIRIIFISSSRVFAFKLVSLFILLLFYCSLVNVNINKSWGSLTYSGYASLYHLGAQSPAALELKQFLATKDQVPECILRDSPYLDVGRSIQDISLLCPDSHRYVSEKLRLDLLHFYIAKPTSLLKLISIGFGASFSNTAAHYGKVIGVLPASVYELYNGSTSPDFRILGTDTQVEALNQVNIGEPIWIYTPGVLLTIASLLLFSYRLYKYGNLKYESLFATLILVLLSNSALTFLLVPSEWVRLSMPNIPIITLLSLIYIAYAIKTAEIEFTTDRSKSK